MSTRSNCSNQQHDRRTRRINVSNARTCLWTRSWTGSSRQSLHSLCPSWNFSFSPWWWCRSQCSYLWLRVDLFIDTRVSEKFQTLTAQSHGKQMAKLLFFISYFWKQNGDKSSITTGVSKMCSSPNLNLNIISSWNNVYCTDFITDFYFVPCLYKLFNFSYIYFQPNLFTGL